MIKRWIQRWFATYPERRLARINRRTKPVEPYRANCRCWQCAPEDHR